MSDGGEILEIATLREKLAVVERERDELKTRAERAEHERNEFKKLYLLVTLELEHLKRQLFGKKAETVDPAQVQLALGPVLDALERARGGGAAELGQVESELEKLRERAQAEVERRHHQPLPEQQLGDETPGPAGILERAGLTNTPHRPWRPTPGVLAFLASL